MFSFLKFLNSKSDSDKNKEPNSLSGKTLNLNGREARALNLFNKSPIARQPNGSNISGVNCTVMSPGFSYHIVQKAREMRSTKPNKDVSNLSTSYTLENSLNGSNTINGINTTVKDVYDKKRKLMETLDSFGVRKRTRQESGIDAFGNRRQRTISESNASDRITAINGHNHRPIQAMNCKNGKIEYKKAKRPIDSGTNDCLSLKKPKTRNNEILSSYSSSKFLRTGQKRSYPTDNESDSPDRKHCKSCTCCGSTVLLESDQNSLNKIDKTTETDHSDDLVTVAASRIFNRSGKTQVVKKICMKSILDEVFDDADPVPYTSIEKVEEKKRKAQSKVVSVEQHTDVEDGKSFLNSAASVSSTITSKLNEIQPPITSVLSTTSSTQSSSNTSLITTPIVLSSTPESFGLHSSESMPKINKENINNTPLQFGLSSPIATEKSSAEASPKQTSEVVKKLTENQTPNFVNNALLFKTPINTVQNPDEPKKLFQFPENNDNIIKDKPQISGNDDSCSDKDKPPLQSNISTSKPIEPAMNSSTVSNPKINENNAPVIQFESQNSSENSKKIAAPSFGIQAENSSKQPAFTFGVPKTNENQSTPVLQFGTPKVDDKQSTPIMQFGTPKVDDKQSTPTIMQFGTPNVKEKKSSPVVQFGTPKTDDQQSAPIIQFGTSKVDSNQSTPIMQFGAPKTDGKQSTPIMQFGTTPKVDKNQSTPVLQFGATKGSENTMSTPSFSFGSTQKLNDNSKQTEPVKFQFGSSKPNNTSVVTSSIEPTNLSFKSNESNQNIFSFGKTDNVTTTTSNPPKYDPTGEKSTPKLQFGALPTPVFGNPNADQLKPQFNIPVSQSVDNQGPKLIFGSQITENKPTTSASGMIFANNTANSMFQFNGSSSKSNDKLSETQSSSFPFSSTKTATFGASAGDKPAFQFNSQKTEEPKSQFSTTAFGSQSATTAPFKFGNNDKPAPFGSNFSSPNQPIQYTNNTELKKQSEPFKFGSTVPTSNAFQFSANKTDNGPVKFGFKATNTFTSEGFSGFGSSTPQQTTTFGTVSSSQPSPFNSNPSPSVATTFGSVAASPPTNTFGTNQGFQFGSSNNTPSSSSTFAFGGNSQPTKRDGAFNFNAAPTTASPFQFSQTSPALSTPQFGGTQPQGTFGFGAAPVAATVMPGSSQPLFSMGTAPAGERRKAKAVRRRQ